MQRLREKIEQSAEKRLILPRGKSPGEELDRYRRFLKAERTGLRTLHRETKSGKLIVNGHSYMMDELLRSVIKGVESNLSEDDANHPPFALVAYGGYGREELNPRSDIDILFLHDGKMVNGRKIHPYLQAMVDPSGLLYTLYDLDLKVGHAVRSIADCVVQANDDMQNKTALIEARIIYGDEKLFANFQKTLEAKCVKGYEDAYMEERILDQNERRGRNGDSPCMQEPNVKNGCGGLRDYQNLFWMAFFKYRARTSSDLIQQGLIAEDEAKEIDDAYDFLLKVRTELHYHTKRNVDVMHKAAQLKVATHLGYKDPSPSIRLELFMKDFYKRTRSIYIMTRVLERRLALIPQPTNRPSFRKLIFSNRKAAPKVNFDGFTIVDGMLQALNKRIFKEKPHRLMRAFVYMQKRGLVLHPDLEQLLRNDAKLIKREFRLNPHVHKSFLTILNQPGNVAPILRAMHETNILGKFLPEFGKLTCLVQHEFFHQYALDEHSLKCIEQLDRVWEAEKRPFSRYSHLFSRVVRPKILYLALLMHDAGKPLERGNHSDAGVKLIGRIARRFAFNTETTEILKTIIQHHLTMIQISQRRDLEDPDVIHSFVDQIGTPEKLIMLTLHTFADSMGTDANLWSDFKDSLLWTLYKRGFSVLSGDPSFLEREKAELERLQKKVRKMAPKSFGDDEVHAHFALMPSRYFKMEDATGIFRDLTMAHRFMHNQITHDDRALEPIVYWHNEPDMGLSALKVCTWDRAQLFVKIAGSLAAAGLNILGAQIFTRTDGIILDTFFVTDADTGKLAHRSEKDAFESIFAESLITDSDLAGMITGRKIRTPMYQALDGERLPTKVEFDNDVSDTFTVIDVETEDRVGLLYFLSSAIAECGLDIVLAKIMTDKGATLDTFYVSYPGGGKVEDLNFQNVLTHTIRASISLLDGALEAG
ncbi:[protein-PII] uridylyltransferase [bacterium]|nr:[protein-PII] uridylyltransferase [bacterium]